jgi:hypothetical protein
VGRHHTESLLDAQVKGVAHARVTCPPRARRQLVIELPAYASPSLTSWQASRAAARSSSNSCCEEL